MTTTENGTRGILLPCPCCGEAEASIRLHLADGSFSCQECDAEFSVADVRSLIARWTPILAWADAMPSAPAA